ncbi:glutamine synthetase [Nocardia puris]|uniref:Glutamine synthetase n=1 Tax=Nocardia puris TaxID=208602 RepID=A0A366DRU4_9NOCA|nr:glutamine synthetase [Nocardia puris]MBF6210720.1 glutamine synthetase [Nocardia puris]MBF6364315.1 glutamine synthetase [Nocardia puris]MBF6459244.1 glutamine synthetase [Nocardia puris]RBO92802.1 glutamine synthetase [Nocardia puris]
MSDLLIPTVENASETTRPGVRAYRLEATNHDGSFLGKMVAPRKFAACSSSGFAFADLLFGLDLGNQPHFGFAYPSWRGHLEDLYFRPDMATAVAWSPEVTSVIGDFWLKTGEPVSICPRNLVRKMVDRLGALGYTATIAVEIETTLFEESIHEARAKGYRDLTPLGGSAGTAYHLARSKDWIDYMTAVEHRLDEIGLEWEAWSDEDAAGQAELNLVPGAPISVCDAWARARQVLREVAFERGHTVTFMAKPTAGYGQASHINLSLRCDGANAFFAEEGPSEVMRHAIGGLLATMPGATSIVLPQITSFRRLVDLSGPPTTISWGISNKTTSVRAVCGHPEYSRLEYRVPGADANLYLAVAAVLAGVIAGLERAIEPPEPVSDMAWCVPPGLGIERIPDTMSKAADALDADPVLREILGEEFVDFWVGSRRWEWMRFHTAGGDPFAELSEWESLRYFEFP